MGEVDGLNKCMMIGEFSKRVGLSVSTIKKYEKQGIIKPHYTSKISRYRYFTELQAEEFIRDYRIKG